MIIKQKPSKFNIVNFNFLLKICFVNASEEKMDATNYKSKERTVLIICFRFIFGVINQQSNKDVPSKNEHNEAKQLEPSKSKPTRTNNTKTIFENTNAEK